MLGKYHLRQLSIVIAGVSLVLTPNPVRAEETLRIVFIAYQNPDRLASNVEPVVTYLEKALGTKVKKFVATDYAGVVEALRNDSADIGFMGPLQYIIAHQHSGAIPLLGEVYGDKASYTSRIFVRKDSGISSLAQLRGKSIAFTDPISSSGFLYPVTIFTDKKLFVKEPKDFFGQVYFSGGDEQSIRAVYNGFVDAAGVGEFSYSLLKAEERDQVIVIGESRPIPSHCVVARKGLAPERRDALRDALLALNEEGPDHKLLKNLYGVDGYVRVTHETFADVAKLAREHGFIKP